MSDTAGLLADPQEVRAILVASGSLTAAPQFEQKRTLGVTYAPQLEQVIALTSSLVPIMLT